jgi:hypothetical protein
MILAKPLLLPSNNIPYNGVIEVREPLVEFLISVNLPFLNSSENDILYSLLKNYTSVKNPLNLYYKDIQFLWYYFLMLLNEKTTITQDFECINCKSERSIIIDLANININYANKDSFLNTKFEGNNWELNFRKRIFKDNIESGSKLININFESLEWIHGFIVPQFISGYYNKLEITKEDLYDVLLELGLGHAQKILLDLRYEDWGMDNSVFHFCSKCNTKNEIFISDPYRSSLYSISELQEKKSELLSTLVTISATKTLSYSEMLNIPISLLETVTDNIKTTIEKKYGDGKSNYLENYEDY